MYGPIIRSGYVIDKQPPASYCNNGTNIYTLVSIKQESGEAKGYSKRDSQRRGHLG